MTQKPPATIPTLAAHTQARKSNVGAPVETRNVRNQAVPKTWFNLNGLDDDLATPLAPPL